MRRSLRTRCMSAPSVGLARPVQVVEDEHDRPLRGLLSQPVDEALDRSPTRRPGPAAAPQEVPARGAQAPRRAVQGRARGCFVDARKIVAQRLGERLVGDREVLINPAEQHQRALLVRARPRLSRASRVLPSPGSPPSSATRRAPPTASCHRASIRSISPSGPTNVHEDSNANLGGNGTGATASPSATGAQPTSTADTGSASPFSSTGPSGVKTCPPREPASQPHRLSRQYLPAAGCRAHARGLHDRRSMTVPIIGDIHIAERHTHAQRQALVAAPRCGLNRLLHRDRAGQRVSRTSEDDHQAVAQALDLAAVVGGRRFSQQSPRCACCTTPNRSSPSRASASVDATASVKRTVSVACRLA